MKIAYLEGPLLDYWVGRAQGVWAAGAGAPLVDGQPYAPSTNWAQGGPIIEREQIDLVCDFGRWMAMHGKHQQYSRPATSPLIAAMRAYLMWEYGDEVPHEAASAG